MSSEIRCLRITFLVIYNNIISLALHIYLVLSTVLTYIQLYIYFLLLLSKSCESLDISRTFGEACVLYFIQRAGCGPSLLLSNTTLQFKLCLSVTVAGKNISEYLLWLISRSYHCFVALHPKVVFYYKGSVLFKTPNFRNM